MLFHSLLLLVTGLALCSCSTPDIDRHAVAVPTGDTQAQLHGIQGEKEILREDAYTTSPVSLSPTSLPSGPAPLVPPPMTTMATTALIKKNVNPEFSTWGHFKPLNKRTANAEFTTWGHFKRAEEGAQFTTWGHF